MWEEEYLKKTKEEDVRVEMSPFSVKSAQSAV